MSNLKGSLNWLAPPIESLGYTTFRGVYVKFSLLLLAPPTELLGFTLLMGVQAYKQPFIVRSTYRNSGSHWGTLHVWVTNIKFSLLLLAFLTE